MGKKLIWPLFQYWIWPNFSFLLLVYSGFSVIRHVLSQVYWCLHIFYGLRAEIFWRTPGGLGSIGDYALELEAWHLCSQSIFLLVNYPYLTCLLLQSSSIPIFVGCGNSHISWNSQSAARNANAPFVLASTGFNSLCRTQWVLMDFHGHLDFNQWWNSYLVNIHLRGK